MAMFDLEDSDDISLERCKTDSGKILKGRKLKEVRAVDCEAKQSPVTSEASSNRSFKFLGLSFGWLMSIVGTVIASAIAAWLGLS